MSSSISSSEPTEAAQAPAAVGGERRWRRFFLTAVATAVGLGLFVYAFVILIDPWNVLPLAPPLPRSPISSNARFSFPALASSRAFDSAIFGTSTSRLLRPAVLDPALGVSFVNLAMNAATAYEQMQLLAVFLRHHAHPKMVIGGIDVVWCETGDEPKKFTPNPFPEWMYQADSWTGYREMFSLYAVQEAGSQLATMTGLKPVRYGADGYTNFLPDESRYDLARVRARLPVPPPAPSRPSTLDRRSLRFPTHPLLEAALRQLPSETRKLLFFVPYYVGLQPAEGSDNAAIWDECKVRIARIAGAVDNAAVADFMITSPITRDESHYWDEMHFRVPIADRLMAGLVDAAARRPSADGDYRLLSAP